MDYLNGKTVRKIPQHIPQDSLLKIKFENSKRNFIELFDRNYSQDVSYSMKKQKRWLISEVLSGGDYFDEDEVYQYTKHQCVQDQKPKKTLYLYDSVSNKKFGSSQVSNQKMSASSVNVQSTVQTLREEHNYTSKEFSAFQNLKGRPQVKRGVSRKNHRAKFRYIPSYDEQLPPKEEYLTNQEKRKYCVHFEEFIHLNNINHTNLEKPQHQKRTEFSSIDMEKTKAIQKSLNQRAISKRYLDWDNDDLDIAEENEELDIEPENCIITPFTVSENNIVRRKKVNEKKKRKRKRNYYHSVESSVTIEEINDNNEVDMIVESNPVVDFTRQALPVIELTITMEGFIEDLDVITAICPCWISETLPRSILIDLDNVLESKRKNFIILQPMFSRGTKSLTLKVRFNMNRMDCEKISGGQFANVREIIEFLQTTIEPEIEQIESSLLSNQILLELDHPMEGVDVVWKTKRIQDAKNLYEAHDEWRNYRFDKSTVASTILNLQYEYNTYSWECCEVCFCDFAEDEVTTMKQCQHKLCDNCLANHIICRLETGMEIINCPGTDCSVTLDCATILSILSWSTYEKRSKKLENQIISKNGSTCFNCGKATLSTFQQSDISRKQVDYRCECGKIVCNICGKRQHWPSSCYDMKKHLQKLKELKDIEAFSDKCAPMIVEGINCPKCMFFVVKNGGCNHMTCICTHHFCWLCGDGMEEGLHKLDGFPCNAKYINNHLTFDLTFITPSPSSIRPKYYILSIQERIKCFDKNRKKLIRKFSDILNVKLEYHDPVFDVKNLENIIFQLIRLTESIYVKAYRVENRKQKTLVNYLKNCALMLIYYQNQIMFKIEDICSQKKTVPKSQTKRKVENSCLKLTQLFADMKSYVSHMHIILQT